MYTIRACRDRVVLTGPGPLRCGDPILSEMRMIGMPSAMDGRGMRDGAIDASRYRREDPGSCRRINGGFAFFSEWLSAGRAGDPIAHGIPARCRENQSVSETRRPGPQNKRPP